jgi:hypothetical protein
MSSFKDDILFSPPPPSLAPDGKKPRVKSNIMAQLQHAGANNTSTNSKDDPSALEVSVTLFIQFYKCFYIPAKSAQTASKTN